MNLSDEKQAQVIHLLSQLVDRLKISEIEKCVFDTHDYLRKTFDKPLGLPLYYNGASNYMILSTRGCGKSFSTAGIITHELLTDGLKYYNSIHDFQCLSTLG
jgi:hypothetical protein